MKVGWQQVGGNRVLSEYGWKDGSGYLDRQPVCGRVRSMDEDETAGAGIQSGKRWWYRHEDGSYTSNGFEKIGENLLF